MKLDCTTRPAVEAICRRRFERRSVWQETRLAARPESRLPSLGSPRRCPPDSAPGPPMPTACPPETLGRPPCKPRCAMPLVITAYGARPPATAPQRRLSSRRAGAQPSDPSSRTGRSSAMPMPQGRLFMPRTWPQLVAADSAAAIIPSPRPPPPPHSFNHPLKARHPPTGLCRRAVCVCVASRHPIHHLAVQACGRRRRLWREDWPTTGGGARMPCEVAASPTSQPPGPAAAA